MYFKLFFSVTIALMSLIASANHNNKQFNQYNKKCYSIDDGLPQNSITDLALLPDGQLLISTYLGVVAFNGSRFTDFVPNGETKFPDTETMSLAVSNKGDVFIAGISTGLDRINSQSIKNWSIKNGLNSNIIHKIVTLDEVAYILNDGELLSIREEVLNHIKLPTNNENSIIHIFKHQNILHLSSLSGLWKRKNSKWVELKTPYKGANITGFKLALSIDEKTLLLEKNGEIFNYNNNNLQLFLTLKSTKSINPIITDLYLDSKHGLWVSTANYGLYYYQNDKLINVIDGSNGKITAILEDQDNVIWLSDTNGLCSLKVDPIKSISKQQGLSNDSVSFLSVDESNKVHVISSDFSNGFYTIDNSILIKTTIDSISTNDEYITSILSDRQNNHTWIATNKNIGKFKNDEFIREIQLSQKSNTILLKNGTVWFDEGSSLVEYKNKIISKTLISPNAEIFSTDFAINGDILIAEKNKAYRLGINGLQKIEIPLNFSACIHEFIQGEIWVCSEGLWLQKNGVNYHFNDEQGLTKGHIHDVINDKFGNIWVMTNAGLFRILRKDIDQLNSNSSDTKVFTRFSEKDGMKTSEFNGSSNGATATENGNLWFASQQGVVSVNPDLEQFHHSKNIKPFVEHFYIGNNLIQKSSWGSIKPNPKTLHFHFSAVFLSDYKNLSFRYKLAGFHDKWQEGAVADFASLSPGSYKIAAQVKYYQHPWSESMVSKFTILPAWYQSLWFRLISSILLVLILFGIPFLRIYLLKNNKKELENLVEEKTKSLMLANKRLDQLSKIDELTEISNRREFIFAIEQHCIDDTDNLFLALIDVDDFKAYNDYYGHLAGDECLIKIASVLDSFSNENCLVARFGGEEFVMLFVSKNTEQASLVIEKLNKLIANQNIEHINSSVKNIVSISTGLVKRRTNETAKTFIDRADIAMYKAKADGKDQYIFEI